MDKKTLKKKYNKIRNTLLKRNELISSLEKVALHDIYNLIKKYKINIEEDYNFASLLQPYWVNYPPDDRGRQPRGDQIPWIEVGEHAVGDNIISNIKELGKVNFYGLPTGPDIRFSLISEKIESMSEGLFNGYWSMTDIKSVGPRDNFNHTVMSHNQLSGSGNWHDDEKGILNDTMIAQGKRTSHKFYCSLPPFYLHPDGQCFLTITFFIKPIYSMSSTQNFAQNLSQIKIGCIPNGLLLSGQNGLLKKYPGLLFPGKDDKTKNPKKLRARIDFDVLQAINPWRLKEISF